MGVIASILYMAQIHMYNNQTLLYHLTWEYFLSQYSYTAFSVTENVKYYYVYQKDNIMKKYILKILLNFTKRTQFLS